MRFDSPTMVQTAQGAVAAYEAGDGPVVVLLHGVFGASPVWRQVAAVLQTGHRVISLDLLGFGASDRPSDGEALWAPNQAAAVLGALDGLGVDRAVFVGYDYGGPVALTLSAQAPERVAGMALTATNAFPDAPIPFPLSTLFLPLLGGLAEAALFSRRGILMAARSGVGRPRITLDPALVLGDHRQSRAVRTLFAQALRELPARYGPVEQAVRALKVPTLVAWGDRDPFFALAHGRRTAEAVPGARFEIYEGAGHFVPEERPERFATDVVALVARCRVA